MTEVCLNVNDRSVLMLSHIVVSLNCPNIIPKSFSKFYI